jgi:hypothetical protein
MLGQRSSAMISLSGHFFLVLRLLCFKEGALGSDMPTQTAVMAYRRSSDEISLRPRHLITMLKLCYIML